MKKSLALKLVAATLSLLFVSASYADTIGVTFSTPITMSQTSIGGTKGFEFTTATDIVITSLGWWDYLGDGLVGSHAVDIWSTTGTVLMSATVKVGDPSQSGFVFDSAITGPTKLLAGTYIIAGLSNTGLDHVAYLSNITTASGITFVQNESNIAGTLQFPNAVSPGVGNAYFGPNFTFTAAAPEPATWVYLSTGLAMVGNSIRRRRISRS